MLRRSSDRDLRALVVKLSTLAEDDVAAILAGLDPSRRREVENLLRELNDGAATPLAQQRPEPQLAFDPTRLSPWLCERMERAGADAITPAAYQKLMGCAVRLFPIAAQRTVDVAPKPPGLVARLKPLFSKVGAAR